MKVFYLIFIFIFISSCGSRGDHVPGYKGTKLNEHLRLIKGKSPNKARKILGKPAMEGRCKLLCGAPDLYRMIYPKNDTDTFTLDVTANTDARVDCVLFDFYPDQKKKNFIFKSYRKAKECNTKDGEIQLLKTYLYSPIELK
jgi:hypothetical protein